MTKSRHRLLTGLVLTLLLSLLLAGCNDAPTPKKTLEYNPAEVVFSVNDHAKLDEVLSSYNLELSGALLVPNSYVGETRGEDARQLSYRMRQDSRVENADPNLILKANPTNFGLDGSNFSFDASSVINGTSQSSDSGYTTAQTQWAWQKINLSAIQPINKGAGVTVAVLDTGVNYNHQDLKGHVLTGYDAITGAANGNDVNGHGTFVAGVILQIAPQVTILPVRVLDASGNGTLSSVVNGLQYAVNQHAAIANLSFSSATDSNWLHNAVQNARSNGMTVVDSAGNEGVSDYYYPAAYSETIGVSATDQSDYRADFANYSSYIQLSAPGVTIYSMYYQGGYGWANGTSFSTPMVVGGLALMKSLHPDYTPDKLKRSIKNAIDKFPSDCSCSGMGIGRLNLAKVR